MTVQEARADGLQGHRALPRRDGVAVPPRAAGFFAEGREGAYVPWRIQQVIDRVRGVATEKGLPPEMVDMVGAQWRNMIGWFVQYEEEKLRKAMEDAGLNRGDAEGLPTAADSANGSTS